MVLSRRMGPVSSLLASPLALCTVTRHAPVGQAGIGHTAQIQVYHCGPIGAVLGGAQPQRRRRVLAEAFHGPPRFVRREPPHDWKFRIVGHASKELAGGPFAREDPEYWAEGAVLEPTGLDPTVSSGYGGTATSRSCALWRRAAAGAHRSITQKW
jgi:hypothetical protein